MKRFLLFFLALFFLFPMASMPLYGETGGADVAQKKLKGETLKTVTRIVQIIFETKHYSGGSVDGKRCKESFDFYLRLLDPNRVYLLQSEVDQRDYSLDYWRLTISNGEYKEILRLHKLIVKRYEEYAKYVRELFAQGRDNLLNTDDEMLIDRKNAPRPKTMEEMKDLWRKQIINSLIIEILADRSAQEKYAEAKKKMDEGTWDKDEVFPTLPLQKPEERILARLDRFVRSMRERDDVEIVSYFLNSLAMTYDPHTCYFPPIEDEDFKIEMSLKLTGIGATLTQEDGYTKIVSLVVGGPAEKSGKLDVGDRITEVAQEGKPAEDVVGMNLSKVVQRIRGPVDSKVTLTVLKAKDGLNGVPQKITLIRKEIQVQDSRASGHIYEVPSADGTVRKLGVITMPSFYFDYEGIRRGSPNAAILSRDMARILNDFKRQGVDGVVCDVRGNGGGSLQDSVDVVGLFTGVGPVVQVKERTGISKGGSVQQEVMPCRNKALYNGPVVVLQDRGSASASEIFAGALQDMGRAVIVGGSKSHGKGSVQTMMDVGQGLFVVSGKKLDAGSVKVTIAKFYRVSGGSTQFKGVVPDIILPSLYDEMETGEDKLDNPLPYDAIKPAKYHLAYKAGILMGKLPELRKASADRVAQSNGFIALGKLIQLYREYRNQKILSLNLEKRIQVEQRNKAMHDEIAKFFENSARGNRNGKKDKHDLNNDPTLGEALNVLNDLIDCLEY